nr:ABC transporter substrate-binding protein [Vallitalea pronyensis]
MKKKWLSIIVLMLVTMTTLLNGCNRNTNLITVRLNEVVHSIFYAPQYVAMEKGFFRDEGLDIELTTGWGADKSMTALISNNADIAFMGPEASIYVKNEGKEDFVINFAQLTQRAGNFLIGRTQEDFDWDTIKGKTIIGGRPGGMPQMVLEYILKINNIDPHADVEILTNIDYTATAGSFIGGTGDYTAEFEPSASKIENEGKGYVVTSLGIESGLVPYTAYMAERSYMKANPDVIQKFTNAIYRGQLWVEEHTPEEIAKVIKPQFKDTDMDLLVQIIDRYKRQDTWRKDPYFEKAGMDLLQNILDTAGELDARVKYDEIVTTEFAEEAIKNIE